MTGWQKLKTKIPVVSGMDTYHEALELFYTELGERAFETDMILTFLKTYNLEQKFYIDYFKILDDLYELKNVIPIIDGGITDSESYKKALELCYNKFDENVFDEKIIKRFIVAYQLNEPNAKFNITFNDILEDISKIKRVLEPEKKLRKQIGTVKDIKSYKEALELYYNVFGEDMFEFDSVQRFIDNFELKKLGITSNMVYKDLRVIKRAFETESEIPSNNVNLKSKQSQTVNTTPSVQTQSKQVRTEGSTPPQTVLDAQTLFDYVKPESVKLNLAKMRTMPVFARLAQLFKFQILFTHWVKDF